MEYTNHHNITAKPLIKLNIMKSGMLTTKRILK